MNTSNIEQKKLVNLNYSLNRELIRSNRAGSYSSTTIIGCNTRKYHGMLICPLEDGSKHVLLSELEDTIIQKDKSFRLGIRKYKDGTYNPHGHTYISGFGTEHIPYKIYTVGGVVLKREMLLTKDEPRIMVRYTILDQHSPVTLRIQPFLAFRSIHEVKRANMYANVKTENVSNGIKSRLYDNYPNLYMQVSRKSEFISAPDWYYDIEYQKEKERGYDYLEDLFVPGFFNVKAVKGDVIVFTAGLEETDTKTLTKRFISEIKNRTPRTDFLSSLRNSAEQFFVKRTNETLITAGFHWYRFLFREGLISLPGLTLSTGNTKLFIEVFDSIVNKFNTYTSDISPDVALRFFRTLQQYTDVTGEYEFIWNRYSKLLIKILKDFNTERFYTKLMPNGLLYIPEIVTTRTWMNETVDGTAVTPRNGYVVEINALWYNALRYFEQIAGLNNYKITPSIQKGIADKVNESFAEIFMNEKENCLYDFVTESKKNDFIRPNQIFAAALPYSPLSDIQKKFVIEKVKTHLITERGLRSLCPQNKDYKSNYKGNEEQRHQARHQGTIHPWLLGLFCEAWLRLHGKDGLNYVTEIYNNFTDTRYDSGIGTVSELYSGNPPYEPEGAISYAPSVAELLRIRMMIDNISMLNFE